VTFGTETMRRRNRRARYARRVLLDERACIVVMSVRIAAPFASNPLASSASVSYSRFVFMEAQRGNVARTRWGVGLIALSCAMLVACDRYEPSSEPGIELPRFERMFEQSDMSPSVLEFSSGSYKGWWGFSVRRDGTVWTYGQEVSQRCAKSREAVERFDCLARGSRLVARLSKERVARLAATSEAARPEDLKTVDIAGADGGFSELYVVRPELPGDALIVGLCSASRYAQLLSKQGDDLVEAFGALRRAVPEPVLPAPWSCPWNNSPRPPLPASFDWWQG
jgi:hypothetical protein